MTNQTMTNRADKNNLDRLFEHLDALTERAGIEQLRDWLTQYEITFQDVQDYVRFDGQKYLRNLMREGAHYHALILCWRAGQRSPIHNHAGSVCGLRVLQGVATETKFEHSPSKLVKAVSSSDMHEGLVAVSHDSDTHQVSNLQTAGTNLVTMHIYSPPLLKMDSFSLTEPYIGEFRPMVLEHVHGSGI